MGIESSCDDSCACLMSWYDGKIEYNNSIHQDETHSQYGGIVPNLASQEHLEHFKILQEQLKQQDLMRIACVAVTTGPGLIGSLLVGVSFAKGIAMALGVPLLRINHLEGHALSCMIENDVKFPFLLLLASGGNSMVVLAKALGEYEIIGQTLDDACGEALDKTAKNLGLDYPGGVNLEKYANKWNEYVKKNGSKDGENFKNRFQFTNGCINGTTFDFSFSGLKTQIAYKIRDLGGVEKLDDLTKAEIAYSAQEAIFETLVKKVKQAIKKHSQVNQTVVNGEIQHLVVCGGVSANKRLSQMMLDVAKKYNLQLIVPSLKYTTDNACMIAKAGAIRWNEWKNNNRQLGYSPIDLSFSPMAKWSIDEVETIWKNIEKNKIK